MEEFLKALRKNDIGKYIQNASMSKYTTYRVGGEAKAIVYPKNTNKLIKLISLLKDNKIKYKILGNGSNVIFSDEKYDGVIIKLDKLDELRISGNNITVGAGYPLTKLVSMTIKKGLAGMEFAAGIPGTVGGSVFMNAGAYNSDMGYIVKSVKVLTPFLQIISLTNKELNFHYRTSFLQKHPDYICLETTIKLQKGDRKLLEEVCADRRKRRRESQPLEYPSAGSVFRNPKDKHAGKLIEDLGLKGLVEGGAQISEKHANFIINKKDAKAEDIKKLIDLITTKVRKEYDIDLRVEQEFVNWE